MRQYALLPAFLHAGWSCISINDGLDTELVELLKLVGAGRCLVFSSVNRSSTGGFILLQYFNGMVSP